MSRDLAPLAVALPGRPVAVGLAGGWIIVVELGLMSWLNSSFRSS
jgi:hypothetical protein